MWKRKLNLKFDKNTIYFFYKENNSYRILKFNGNHISRIYKINNNICTCRGFMFRKTCKHIKMLKYQPPPLPEKQQMMIQYFLSGKFGKIKVRDNIFLTNAISCDTIIYYPIFFDNGECYLALIKKGEDKWQDQNLEECEKKASVYG